MLLKARLFNKNPNLTAIMNKSRIFNTYVAIVELLAIFFFLAIPGRTNQNLLVGSFMLQSAISIVGEMYIQMQNKIGNYRLSIQINLVV